MSSDVGRQIFQAAGASAGAPAGLAGALLGSEIGKEAGVSAFGPATKIGKSALTRELTEEELKDKRAKARREEEIKLMQERPGKAQTALTDLSSQSAFPFRLY
jgi:hypothetical protein